MSITASPGASPSGYSDVRPGYMVEPECCIHDAGDRHQTCPDCGLTPKFQEKERELRERGWTVAQIAEMGLMDQ